MAATAAATPDLQKAALYNKQHAQLTQIRKDLLLNAAASGEWETQTVKAISSTQRLTKAIQQQKLSVTEYYRAKRDGTLKAAAAEQQALQNAFATQTTGSAYGKSAVDLFIPKRLTAGLRDARIELGMLSHAQSAAALQMQNWGKNTQWAGRQLMVGFTVPLGIAALGLGKLAYEVDANLTRIAKVYDTSSTNQMGKERELAALRENSLSTATAAAKEYGIAMSDILNIQAQLASTGLTGTELQRSTEEVARISFLGDLEHQSAIEMTIALQTAFGLSIDELTEKFNFMNQVENSTSLTIQDIAEATPRAASALSSLGVSVEEMTVLLVSMKESGVDAAEGANALKSATTRLLNPTRGAVEMFKGLKSATTGVGINIEQIVEQAGGNLFDVLKQLGKEMENLDPLAKQQAVAELFGTYQFNRLNASLTNVSAAMAGVGDASNQTAQAVEAAGMSAGEWADTAASEVAKMQQSISGRFKIAVESLKSELVPLGLTILSALTPIVEIVTSVVSWFNSWGDGMKKFTLIALGLIAIAGPVVMLIGLFGNLIGSLGRGYAAIGKLISGFTPMTAEQRAQQLMAQRTSNIWDEQASSAAILSQSIDGLTKAMHRNAVAQGLMVGPTGQIGQRQIVSPAHGTPYYAAGSMNDQGKRLDGMPVTPQDAALYGQMKADTADMTKNTEKMRTNWGGIAMGVGSFALGAIAVKDMLSGSNGLMNNMLNIAMVAGSLAGMGVSFKSLGGILTRALSPLNNLMGRGILGAIGGKISSGLTAPFTATAAAVSSRTGILGGLGRMSGAIGRVLPSALRLFGPIGVIAGAVGIIATIIDKMDELEERQLAINKSAKQWADILGFAYQQGALGSNADNKKDDWADRIDDVKALRDANGDLVDKLKEAAGESDNFASVYRVAMAEALKVVSHGGTVEQARQAMGIALQAAGLKEHQIDKLLVRFDSVDLSNPDQVRSQLVDQIQRVMDSIPGDGGPGFLKSMFGGDISDDARAAGSQAGQQFADAYISATSEAEKADLLKKVMGIMQNQFKGDFDKLKEDWDKEFAELGITSINSLANMARKNPERIKDVFGVHGENAVGGFMDKYEEQMDTFWQSFGDEYGLTDEQVDRLKKGLAGADYAADQLGVSLRGVAGGGRAVENSVNGATNAIIGFNRATAMADPTQVTSALQGTYSGVTSDIFAEADRLLDEQFSAEIDKINENGRNASAAIDRNAKAIEKSFDNRQKAMDSYWKGEDKAFESRWKNTLKSEEAAFDARERRLEDEAEAVDKSFDNRIEAIEATIEAEQKAEDARQKIFDAEERRIERMSARFNNNIDFNAALNSGELDEAARILNNAGAEEAQWINEDAKRTEEEVREARLETYRAEMDALKEQQSARAEVYNERLEQLRLEKEARMEQLREIQDAEKEAMADRKAAQQEALAHERQMAQEGLAATREKAAAQTQAEAQRVQRTQEAQRRALEQELRALREFIPTNEQELRDHIARVETAYAKYGLNLQGQGNAWSQYIGNSLTHNINAASARIQNEIAWQKIGEQITNRLATGTGVSMGDLAFFLQNGRFPSQSMESYAKAWGNVLRAGSVNGTSYATGGFHIGGVVRHGGGPSWTSKDRTGVPRSAGIYPTEVQAILKRGEYVVNEKSTRKHLPLLESINAGRDPLPGSREGITRHGGGIAEATQAIVGGRGSMLSQMLEAQAAKAMTEFKAVGIALARQASVGSGLTGGNFGTAGNWPPARPGVVAPNTAAAVAFIRKAFPQITSIGTLGSRPNKSDHPMGKAADFMIPNWQGASGIGLGNAVASHFVNNPNQFGTKYVIWRDKITSGQGWQPYTHPNGATANPTLRHMDHVHTSFKHKGGEMQVPSLRVGGEALYDNTLANLHRRETVLTAPLSNKLERGIDKLESGAVNHLTIDLRGATVRDDDVDKIKAIVRDYNNEVESNRGRSRKVTTR